MLLSMFISLILARKFKGKVFVLLMTAVLILISVSSIGFPSVWGSYGYVTYYRGTFWQLNSPAIPLSFPFHVSMQETYRYTSDIHPKPPAYEGELFFLWSTIDKGGLLGLYLINLTTSYITLLVSLFLLVNLVGAIFGYWISKTTFIDRYFARRKPATETT